MGGIQVIQASFKEFNYTQVILYCYFHFDIFDNFEIDWQKTNIHDIESQKAIFIERFKQVNDINLIHAIKSLLDYASKKEQESLEVPEAHQKLVKERFDRVRKDPGRLLDWDEAKKTLKS